jgi:hypothetical protein
VRKGREKKKSKVTKAKMSWKVDQEQPKEKTAF